MEREGQTHSWVSGTYWTLVVMSTLGFGDITFPSDVGRAFSVVVLLSGTIFMLVLVGKALFKLLNRSNIDYVLIVSGDGESEAKFFDTFISRA